MDIIAVNTKDQLDHFLHEHPLSLVHLQQPNHINKNDDDEDKDEDEDEDESVEEEHHGGQCQMCNEQIYSFHLCYYKCKSCDYSLHKLCAELPVTQQNHPLHPGHDLTLSKEFQGSYDYDYYQSTDIQWKCFVCNLKWKNTYNYHCSICKISMDIVCATMSDQTIEHPSHPHRLERMSGKITSSCVACGDTHRGVFFQCSTCLTFRINLDCALLPTKLLIQNPTNGIFTHSHPLSLAFCFPFSDKKDKYFPSCRVCDNLFYEHLWIYKCDKCRYYVHVGCATSKNSLHARVGKFFKEAEYPNLIHCPFPDEGDNLLKRHISNQKGCINNQHEGEILNHSSHQHPLILVNKLQNSFGEKSISLHDPMKRIQLLCDGCVKPITAIPFYTCSLYDNEKCCFVLHEWCTKLPSQVQGYVGGHPEHALFLIPKIINEFFGVFYCDICELPSNGFAYGCTMCEYYVDINCAFTPKEITHDAHPDHLLLKAKFPENTSSVCSACQYNMEDNWGFHCPSCDFYIHTECALLLPREIKNKCDRHPLSLRYEPAENHLSEYFCEICEDEFDPWKWFYHCSTCAQSIHVACAPVICQNEQATYAGNYAGVYKFLNVKFGGSLKIRIHSHRLAFVQGLERDGECFNCMEKLQNEMIFKCLGCDFAVDYDCASSLVN